MLTGKTVHVVVPRSVQPWLKRLFYEVRRSRWRKGSRKLRNNDELTAAGWTVLSSSEASVLPACVRSEHWRSFAEEESGYERMPHEFNHEVGDTSYSSIETIPWLRALPLSPLATAFTGNHLVICVIRRSVRIEDWLLPSIPN